MTEGALTITNRTARTLVLDTKIDEDRAIRATLDPAGTVGGTDTAEVGTLATLEELFKDEGIRTLLDETPPAIAITAISTAVPFIKNIPSQGTATPNDYVLVQSMPFAAEIVDYQILVSTASAGESWQLRDALAGAGNVLSDDLNAAATGRVRDAGVALAGVVGVTIKDAPLVLRRSGGDGAVGIVIVTFNRLG